MSSEKKKPRLLTTGQIVQHLNETGIQRIRRAIKRLNIKPSYTVGTFLLYDEAHIPDIKKHINSGSRKRTKRARSTAA